MSIDTSKLNRYKPGYVHSNDGPGYISMLARDDGEYVRLEDVKAISSAIEQAMTQQRDTTPQTSADAVREYDRELIARMLLGPRVFSPESVAEQARLLREADNLEADARTVVRTASSGEGVG